MFRLLRFLAALAGSAIVASAAGPLSEALDAPDLDFIAPPVWQAGAGSTPDRAQVVRVQEFVSSAIALQSAGITTVVQGPSVVSFDWLVQEPQAMQVAVNGVVLLAGKGRNGWKTGKLNLPAGSWSLTWNVAADEVPFWPRVFMFSMLLDRVRVEPGAVLNVAAALDDQGGVWALDDAGLVEVLPGAGIDGSAVVRLVPATPRTRLSRLVTPQARATLCWKSKCLKRSASRGLSSEVCLKRSVFLRSY